MLTGFIFYFLIVVPGTGGEICMSRTMKTVGEVTDFRPRAILSVLGRAIRVPWFWIGITMMATGFRCIARDACSRECELCISGHRD